MTAIKTEELTERAVRELERIRQLMEEEAARKRKEERDVRRWGDSHQEIRRRNGTLP